VHKYQTQLMRNFAARGWLSAVLGGQICNVELRSRSSSEIRRRWRRLDHRHHRGRATRPRYLVVGRRRIGTRGRGRPSYGATHDKRFGPGIDPSDTRAGGAPSAAVTLPFRRYLSRRKRRQGCGACSAKALDSACDGQNVCGKSGDSLDGRQNAVGRCASSWHPDRYRTARSSRRTRPNSSSTALSSPSASSTFDQALADDAV
jgi:hypothetical protein